MALDIPGTPRDNHPGPVRELANEGLRQEFLKSADFHDGSSARANSN